MYLFDRINYQLSKEGQQRKQVLFCGPSNKSVDLVASNIYFKFYSLTEDQHLSLDIYILISMYSFKYACGISSNDVAVTSKKYYL